MKLTNTKVVISGKYVEVYMYQKAMGYDFVAKRSESSTWKEKTTAEAEDILKRSGSRTRKKLLRIINANAYQWKDTHGRIFTPKFASLTFNKPILDVSEANVIFTNFVKRLNYHVNNNKTNHFKYIAVPEFQKKSKRVHFHVVFFNLHWFNNSQLNTIWGNGFVNIKNTKNIDNIGLYLTKYLNKDMTDKRLLGKKKYFASRNLKKPVIVRDNNLANKIAFSIQNQNLKYESEFESDYQGLTKYRLYKISYSPLISYVIKSKNE